MSLAGAVKGKESKPAEFRWIILCSSTILHLFDASRGCTSFFCAVAPEPNYMVFSVMLDSNTAITAILFSWS